MAQPPSSWPFHHVKISLIARRPTIWAWRRPSWRWLRIWCRCSWTWKLGSAMAWKMMDIFGRIWLIKYNMSCKSGWKRWNHWRLKIVGEKLVVSTWNWLNQWWCPEDSAKQDWGLAGWEENSENSCPRSGGQDLQKDADGCFKNKGIFWALLSNLVCLEKNLESQQIECWVLVGRWFLGVAEALGLKVKTGVKVLEIQTGDGGLQGVKIEQEGAEDRARAGICYGKEALQWKTFKKLKRRMSSTQNGCFFQFRLKLLPNLWRATQGTATSMIVPLMASRLKLCFRKLCYAIQERGTTIIPSDLWL